MLLVLGISSTQHTILYTLRGDRGLGIPIKARGVRPGSAPNSRSDSTKPQPGSISAGSEVTDR